MAQKTDCEKTTRQFIDTARWEGDRGTENFAFLIERLVGDPAIRQLQFNNGAHVSSILEFMADNPGLVEVMVEWVEDNYADQIEDDEHYDGPRDDDEEETDEDASEQAEG